MNFFSLPVCVLFLSFDYFKTVSIIEPLYELEGPEIETRWERDFPCRPYRPDIYPVSCTMLTDFFLNNQPDSLIIQIYSVT